MLDENQTVLSLATTPLQEAAQNIDRSRLFDIHPDSYQELKDHLNPEAETIEREPASEDATLAYQKQSTQHASLAKEDSGILDYISRQGKFIVQQVSDVPTNAKSIVELRNKEMDDPKNFSDNDREILKGLNEERASLNKNDYGITGTIEQLPGQVAGAVSEMFNAVKENSKLVASFTGASALAGTLVGVGIPVPGTAAVGGIAGAIEGFGTGVTVANFIKGYQDTRGLFSNELESAKDEKGQPLNLSLESRTNISHGVALVAGAASAFVGNKLAKGNPLLSKFLSPTQAATIVSNPALRAKVDVLGYIARSALSGGGASAVGELAKIVGEEFAKSDKSDASIENIISNLATPETRDRLVKAGVIGAASAGAVAGATSIPSYGKIKSNYVEMNNTIGSMLGDNQIVVHEDGTYSVEPKNKPAGPSDGGVELPLPKEENYVKESTKVLNAQDAIMNIAKASSVAKMNKASPVEMSNFKKMMFSTIGLNQKFWLTVEDMRAASTSPEHGEMIRNKIDPSGVLNSQINAPISIEPHKFLDIVKEFPEVSEYVRMNPDAPNPKEARNYLERLQDAHGKREEILSSLGVDKSITTDQNEVAQQALNSVQEATQPFSESEYYNKPTFTDAIEGVLSKNEVDSYNIAQINARLAVGESLKAEVESSFKTKENAVFKTINQQQIKQELSEHEAALEILNRFESKKRNTATNELLAEHNELGVKTSPYAIDPRYLPDDVREAMVSEPMLMKRKVFVTGGLSPDEAAVLLNVDSGENLIKILANTPDKKDIIKRRDQLKIDLRNQIQQGFKPDLQEAKTEAFTNLAKTHLREMKFMKDKEWTQTKSGIKRIALPLPTIEEVNMKAVGVINTTPIGELNHNQYVVGERKSQRAAVDHILNNEVEQAFKAKENAALNMELVKETILAKSKVKKAETFLKTLNDEDIQQELKDAKYLEPVNELLSLYKLDTSKRGLQEKGKYDEWVKSQVEKGNVDFSIPERFNDIRESANELSVEQYLTITDRLKSLVYLAKRKNKLFNKFKEKELLQTEEALVTHSGLLLEKHPDFNIERSNKEDVPVESLDSIEQLKGVFSSIPSILTNAENIITTLDEEKLSGFHHDLLIKKSKDAYNAKQEDISKFVDHFKANINIYGEKEFNKNFTARVFIKEFENFPDLGNGFLPRKNLLTLLAYMGDPYTKEKLSNYVSSNGERTSADSIMKVLERELTEKDATFVQNMMLNSFKSYEKRSFDLHLETTGEEPKMVKGAPFTFNVMKDGKVEKTIVLDGGYYPAKYRATSESVKIDKVIKKTKEKASILSGLSDGKLYGQLKAAEMTEQGRFEARKGSTRPLDSNFNNFVNETEAILHDLNFRKAGIDTLQLLKNPILSKNIKSVVGNTKYKLLVNSMIEVIGETQEKNNNYFGDQQRLIDDVLAFQEKGFAMTILSANLSSIMIQPLSVVNSYLRMGESSKKHFLKTASAIGTNLHMLHEFVKVAEELNPSLKHHKDGIDDTLIKSSYNFLASDPVFLKNYKKTGKALSLIKNGQDFAMNFLMSGMSEADRINKVVVTHTAYSQFVSGETENYPMEKLQTMSKQEILDKAKDYIGQVSRTSLTSSAIDDKSAFEKISTMRFFNKFWTDSRSQLNTQMSVGRKVKWGYKKAKEGVKEKDFKKVKEGAGSAFSNMTSMLMGAMATKLIADVVRGNNNPTDNLEDIKDEKSFNTFAKNTFGYFSTSIPETITEVTPFAKDAMYAYNKKGRDDYKNVQFPIVKYSSDMVTGISGLADLLDMSGEGNVSSKELKAMLMSAGYLSGGLPVNGLYKMKRTIEGNTFQSNADHIKSEAKRLNQNINLFIDRFSKNPNAKDYIEDLKQVQKEILPKYDNDIKNIIPQDTKEVIKQVMSKGDSTKFDPSTGATGIYQFTEDQWTNIKASAPELGLTDNGRVSQNSKQQEKALDWEIKDNSRGLLAYDMKVNNENLLAAHKFGLENYAKIASAKDSQKLTELLGNEANNPVFDNFKNVKEIKDFLAKEIKKLNNEGK